MNDIRVLFGNRIRSLRKELGISQEALALRAGLDRTYVASIENGKRNVSVVNIEKLVIALNTSLSDFFYSPEFNSSSIKSISKVAEKKAKYDK